MTCASGFISIIDPFLNPDGSQWTGSITYTLRYATTAAGATVVNAEQQFNVANGIDICLAPGLYTVVLQQSGFAYAITSEWGVPVSGGPYTVAEISSNVTLQGSFGAVTLSGTPSTGQVPTATSPTTATWQTPGGGGGGLVLSQTTSISQAEVLALNDTPIAVTPTPPAGTVLLMTGWALQITGNADYTVDDNLLLLRLHDATIQEIFAFAGSTGDANYFQSQFAIGNNGYQLDAFQITGRPLMATTTDANPTGTGGPLIVTIWYVLLPGVA